MNDFWECDKKPNECPYRYDYRGCTKQNCPFPHIYIQKEAFIFNEKWGIRAYHLEGYDFTFKVNNKYYYAKEIFMGYGMACNTIGYEIYRISEEEYENNVPFSKLNKKKMIASAGTNTREDNFYLQFLNI